MPGDLQIYDPRERWLVGCADAVLRAGAAVARLGPRRSPPPDIRRVLALRLERIGDLLMTLDALAALRRRAASAEIHLVVGSWNASLARLVTSVDRMETLDVPWLAREGTGDSIGGLARRARVWRHAGYDLVINFEPDIRTNALAALSGAPRRLGFRSRGGGALLTSALEYDTAVHTAINARRLVDEAFPHDAAPAGAASREGLALPAEARQRAEALLAAARRPRIGVHASGGRPVKQWDLGRFAEVANRLADAHDATIVLTGGPGDRAAVDAVKAGLGDGVPFIDAATGFDLVGSAALIERLDLLVTGDTGPMHLAAAVGTPVVAIFGPSDPVRWGPLTETARVVRSQIWCSPCNRVRRPPQRCAGVTPDCLVAVEADEVCRAADDLLGRADAAR